MYVYNVHTYTHTNKHANIHTYKYVYTYINEYSYIRYGHAHTRIKMYTHSMIHGPWFPSRESHG